MLTKASRTDFPHPNPMACGYYVAQFLLRHRGSITWPEEPKSVLSILLHLDWTFPSKLQRMLLEHGQESEIICFKDGGEGLTWVRHELKEGRPVALFVRAKPLHWIVVAGHHEGLDEFYVYDSRIGKGSSVPDLEIGNRLMSPAEVLDIWRGVPFFRWIGVGVK